MLVFPSFVWTVRDFTLELELKGKPITADEYLENALKLKSGETHTHTHSLSLWDCLVVRQGIDLLKQLKLIFIALAAGLSASAVSRYSDG